MERTPYSPPQARVADISPTRVGDVSWGTLTREQRSAFFWACMRRWLWINVLLFAISLVSGVVMTAVLTVVARVNGAEVGAYVTAQRVVAWLLLTLFSFGAAWSYTRWLIATRVGTLRVVVRDDGKGQAAEFGADHNGVR